MVKKGYYRNEDFSLMTDCIKLSYGGLFITTLSGPSISVFSPNTGKYGPEKTPYSDTFYVVYCTRKTSLLKLNEYCEISIRSMKNYSDKIFVEQLRATKFTGYLSYTPANTLSVFHVETMSFPRRFNVEYTWCVCRDLCEQCLPGICN